MSRKVEVIAKDLFKELENFGNLYTAKGKVQTTFDNVQGLLVELHEADPKYQEKLGVAKPYGQEVKGEMLRWLLDYCIAGRWYIGTPLVAVVERLFSQAAIPGNPLNRD